MMARMLSSITFRIELPKLTVLSSITRRILTDAKVDVGTMLLGSGEKAIAHILKSARETTKALIKVAEQRGYCRLPMEISSSDVAMLKSWSQDHEWVEGITLRVEELAEPEEDE